MKPEETWIGIGVKSGGMLGFGGYESTTGKFFNVANPNVTYDFTISTSRWGLGLGGGGGLVVIIVYKLKGFFWLHNRPVDDWGINISMAGKYGDALKVLNQMEFFKKVKTVGSVLDQLLPLLDDFRNAASFVFNALELDMKDEHPILALEVPGVGFGLELSAFKLKGKIYIDD